MERLLGHSLDEDEEAISSRKKRSMERLLGHPLEECEVVAMANPAKAAKALKDARGNDNEGLLNKRGAYDDWLKSTSPSRSPTRGASVEHVDVSMRLPYLHNCLVVIAANLALGLLEHLENVTCNFFR